jgi:hypothetical protein
MQSININIETPLTKKYILPYQQINPLNFSIKNKNKRQLNTDFTYQKLK